MLCLALTHASPGCHSTSPVRRPAVMLVRERTRIETSTRLDSLNHSSVRPPRPRGRLNWARSTSTTTARSRSSKPNERGSESPTPGWKNSPISQFSMAQLRYCWASARRCSGVAWRVVRQRATWPKYPMEQCEIACHRGVETVVQPIDVTAVSTSCDRANTAVDSGPFVCAPSWPGTNVHGSRSAQIEDDENRNGQT